MATSANTAVRTPAAHAGKTATRPPTPSGEVGPRTFPFPHAAAPATTVLITSTSDAGTTYLAAGTDAPPAQSDMRPATISPATTLLIRPTSDVKPKHIATAADAATRPDMCADTTARATTVPAAAMSDVKPERMAMGADAATTRSDMCPVAVERDVA